MMKMDDVDDSREQCPQLGEPSSRYAMGLTALSAASGKVYLYVRASPAGGFAHDESLFVRLRLLILCYCFDGEVFLDLGAD